MSCLGTMIFGGDASSMRLLFSPVVWGLGCKNLTFLVVRATLSIRDLFLILRRQFMATRTRRPVRKYLIQKPTGTVTRRVRRVGPEHFGVLCFDCAKARSKWMLADFYGTVLRPPQTVEHTSGHLHALIDQVRQAGTRHELRDLIVAIERTGEYHRP